MLIVLTVQDATVQFETQTDSSQVRTLRQNSNHICADDRRRQFVFNGRADVLIGTNGLFGLRYWLVFNFNFVCCCNLYIYIYFFPHLSKAVAVLDDGDQQKQKWSINLLVNLCVCVCCARAQRRRRMCALQNWISGVVFAPSVCSITQSSGGFQLIEHRAWDDVMFLLVGFVCLFG